jgi:FtsZ-interacting cell division protein ZipA
MPKILLLSALSIVLLAVPDSFAYAQEGEAPVQDQRQGRQGDRNQRQQGGGIDREKLKQELMSLSPEERQQRIKEIREKHRGKMQQGKQKFEQRWQNATSEERAQLCVKLQQRCEQGGKKHACRAQSAKCK